jgi:predicted transposase YdaD
MIEDGLERMKQRERKIGEARGIEIGEARGEAKGEAKGKYEQKLDTAKKLLAKGHSPKEVAEIVELDEEEIHKLLH